MQARKKASASPKDAKKRTAVKKASAKKASAKKASAKTAASGRKTTKVRAKKKSTARLAKPRKPQVKMKADTKTQARHGTRSARRRKAPIVRRSAPKARERAVRDAGSTSSKVARAHEQTEAIAPLETEPNGVAKAMMPPAAEVETAREPLRGGYHDPANHSKPAVQIQKQHMRVLRGPERRPSMRGH
jgi:hypothetical protein